MDIGYCLFADSGSTKTDWLLVAPDGTQAELHTGGINPARDARDIIYNVLRDELLPRLPHPFAPEAVHFYGAGCIEPFSRNVEDALVEVFPKCRIEVASDLLGAARALCGHAPGIACILGTGSNSCLFDGKDIAMHTPPLGYILGDEGSGSYLGKTLLNAVFKGLLPENLSRAFSENYGLTQPDIIRRVYREPAANVFLASLVPFIAEHSKNPAIHDMLVDAFRLFLTRNVAAYGHPEMPVHCVGGIAYQFAGELAEAIGAEGMKSGRILRRPVEEMAKWHTSA